MNAACILELTMADNIWVKNISPAYMIAQITDMKGYYDQMLIVEEDVGKKAVYRSYSTACKNAILLCKKANDEGKKIVIADTEAMMVPSSSGGPYRTSLSVCMCEGKSHMICKHRLIVRAAREVVYGESHRLSL